MRVELRAIGPVFLVLFAGYLATSLHDADFSLGFFSVTGGAITDQSGTEACPSDKILFRVSGPGNAHAALATQTQYTYAVCWDGQGATNRQCNNASSNVVLRLSDVTNAHVENKELTNYQQRVCFGNITCSVQPQGQCSALGPTSRCIASLSAETNAHVAECAIYPFDLCCSDGSAAGGGLYRPDTDHDSVFDIGLGTLRNIPCNPRVHTDLTQCADNCINAPNADQADQDGDGAGDVCDDFMSDSCSIRQLNDNCQHLQQCRNLAARWATASVYEGDPASLEVTGSAECSSKIVLFQVFDKNNRNLLTISPQPSTFANATVSMSASSSWIGEYYLNQSNEYYFQATVTGGGSQIQVSSSQTSLLTVQRRAPGQAVCGNGRVEGSNNETCDPPATGSCSSACQIISGGTNGSCKDDALCRTVTIPTYMVCQSDQTQAYFCITGPGGCRRLSNAIACGRDNGVQRLCNRGADICRSPTCSHTYLPTACTNGQLQISCTATPNLPHCTSECAGYPRTQSCAQPTQEEPFPVFTGFNFIVTILLLITFYTFKRGVRWKSR